LHAMSVLQEQG